MTTIWSTPGRCTSRLRSCWRICRRACGWWCPAGLTRRCRWRGCGPAASWLRCASPTCASPLRRRRRCWVRRPDRAGPARPGRRRRGGGGGLAGGVAPPLPLARLRARGQLAEMRVADLRFTPEEAATLLGEAAGPGLPGPAVAALTARTEGWAAGLQLAALSLRGQADAAGFVAAVSGSHRFGVAYLAEEVLAGQPGPVRAFLLETSVLERLTGELCDAVTGRPGSQAMLEQVERAGLFLVPLDEVRGWWRYHHLFADLLRARL